jgi:hypothetical protein
MQAFEEFVTPITPYLICDHYIATELLLHKGEAVDGYPCLYDTSNPNTKPLDVKISANDLLKNQNYSTIKNLDIVQCQFRRFEYFFSNVLPFLKKNNIKIILLTSQDHAPALTRSDMTDKCLNDENIILWISQNPIYCNHEKYMAFPYGIRQYSVAKYADFVRKKDIKKSNTILNLRASAWGHLPDNHIRKKYDIFGKDSTTPTGPTGVGAYDNFLNRISTTKFLISTGGDRDDCYRHYESIGLGAVPVSNIRYKEIFGDNMIYSDADEMVDMVTSGKVPYRYNRPNKEIITVRYWKHEINKRFNKVTRNPGYLKYCLQPAAENT